MAEVEWHDILDRRMERIEDAFVKLVQLEERQVLQNERIAELIKDGDEVRKSLAKAHERITVVDKKVDTWVNRGKGLWFAITVAATVIFTVAQFWPTAASVVGQ